MFEQCLNNSNKLVSQYLIFILQSGPNPLNRLLHVCMVTVQHYTVWLMMEWRTCGKRSFFHLGCNSLLLKAMLKALTVWYRGWEVLFMIAVQLGQSPPLSPHRLSWLFLSVCWVFSLGAPPSPASHCLGEHRCHHSEWVKHESFYYFMKNVSHVRIWCGSMS